MKKLLVSVLLILSILFSLFGCNALPNDDTSNEEPGDTTPAIVIASTPGTEGLDYYDYDDGTCLLTGIGSATNEKEITIPSHNSKGNVVTRIAQDAFKNAKLEKITISQGVSNIGTFAFYDCANLTTVSFVDDSYLKTIEPQAFYNCKNLTTVTLPDGLTTIKSQAFGKCTSLETISFPDSVTNVASNLFDGCSKFNFNLYDNAKYVGDATNPYKILVDVVTELEDVWSVVELQKVYERDKEGTLVYKTFCQYDTLNKPYSDASGNNVINLEYDDDNHKIVSSTDADGTEHAYLYAKTSTKKLINSCNININCKVIANSAFINCTYIKNIEFPQGLKYIGDYAFYGCTSLVGATSQSKEYNFDGDLVEIGDFAFFNCNVGKVTLGKNVNLGYSTFVADAKTTSKGPKEFVVHSDNPYFSTINGNLYNKDGTVLIRFANGQANKEIIIPDGVKEIREAAFSYSGIKSVYLPESVEVIGGLAFHYSAVEEINIKNKTVKLGNFMIYRALSIKKINFSGTKAEWDALTPNTNWDYQDSHNATFYTIYYGQ